MSTKKRLPLSVPCPTDERWSEMTEEDGGRRCARCDRHIFDFSQLTESQAAEVTRLSGGTVCRRVKLDEDGAPIYLRRAMRRVVSTAAGVVFSVSLAACDSDTDEPPAHPSAVVAPPAAELIPVAPVPTPTPTATPEPTPAPEPEIEPATDPESAAPTGPAMMRRRPHPSQEVVGRTQAAPDDEIVGLESF